MSFNYAILFQVDVLHSYFTSGLATGLRFEPTPQCAALLQDYHLNFKTTNNGCILITEKVFDGVNWVQRIPIDVGTCFNFFVYSSMDDFLNITDAALANFSGGQKFFFGNNATTPTTSTPPVLSFNVWNSTTLTQALTIASTAFVATVNRAVNPVWFVLLDVNGNTVIKTRILRDANNEIVQDNVLLSPQPFDENIYTLQQTDATGTVLFSQVFFLTDGAAGVNAAGIFQIQYNTAVDAAVTANGQIHFTATLAARKIKWLYRIEVDQYQLITEQPNNYDPTKLCLYDATNNVPVLGTSFTPTVLAGTPAFVTFESAGLIDLKESPYKGIPLIDKGPPLASIITDLPNPSPQWLLDAGGGNYKAEVALKIK